MSNNTPSLAILERQINRAERDLIESRSHASLDEEDGIAVLFTGNHHDAFPRHLVINPWLNGNEKVTWQVIRLSITDPSRPGSTPKRSEIAAMVNCSLPTVTSSRTMLRIRGWMTYCRSVRKAGRFIGDIYLLNDEPLTLQTILELDSTYIPFLEQQVKSDSKRHKQAAAEVLAEIEKMTTGTPPTEMEVMGARINRAMSAPSFNSHQSKNFAPVNSPDSADALTQNTTDQAKSGTYSDQSKNFASVETHQDKNFSLVENKKFALENKNFFASPGSCSSSYINNKYISNARARDKDTTTSQQGLGRSEPESLANYLDIQRMGRYGLDADDENRWIKKHLPILSHDSYKVYVQLLHYGRDSVLPAIQRKTQRLTPPVRDVVLAQLLGAVAAAHHGWRDAIRDPIGYLHKLVQLHEYGNLVPDEWAMEILRIWHGKEKLLPNFVDSPQKLGHVVW